MPPAGRKRGEHFLPHGLFLDGFQLYFPSGLVNVLVKSGWAPEKFAADRQALADLPANMIDRARVAVRNYAAGACFSTYPAFGM